jgi:hypothetical protein
LRVLRQTYAVLERVRGSHLWMFLPVPLRGIVAPAKRRNIC